MKYNYPKKSKFLDKCETVIRQNKILLSSGMTISIEFSDKGYSGKVQVLIDELDNSRFDTNWSGKDPTRFPARIKATALALFRQGCFGQHKITHRKGRIEISRPPAELEVW